MYVVCDGCCCGGGGVVVVVGGVCCKYVLLSLWLGLLLLLWWCVGVEKVCVAPGPMWYVGYSWHLVNHCGSQMGPLWGLSTARLQDSRGCIDVFINQIASSTLGQFGSIAFVSINMHFKQV